MKLHIIKYSVIDPDKSGLVINMQAFEASDGMASKRVTEIKKELKDTLDDKPTREPIDIPTDKAGLLEWLNENASVAGVVIS